MFLIMINFDTWHKIRIMILYSATKILSSINDYTWVWIENVIYWVFINKKYDMIW
jgi:hypothetical protein